MCDECPDAQTLDLLTHLILLRTFYAIQTHLSILKIDIYALFEHFCEQRKKLVCCLVNLLISPIGTKHIFLFLYLSVVNSLFSRRPESRSPLSTLTPE